METTFHSLAAIGTSRARQPKKTNGLSGRSHRCNWRLRLRAFRDHAYRAASMSQVRDSIAAIFFEQTRAASRPSARHCGSGRGLFRNLSTSGTTCSASSSLPLITATPACICSQAPHSIRRSLLLGPASSRSATPAAAAGVKAGETIVAIDRHVDDRRPLAPNHTLTVSSPRHQGDANLLRRPCADALTRRC